MITLENITEEQAQQLENIITILDETIEGGLAILNDDEAIELGKTCSWEKPLTKEQKAIIKVMRNCAYPATVKRERKMKKDADKSAIIDKVKEKLTGVVSNLETTNPNKLLTFTYNGKKYKLTLLQEREEKKP